MAIIQFGGGVAEARGSVGGTVFSRNKAGAYMRNRVTPVNPGSSFQQNVRFAVATLASRWVEILTPAQRAAWETYSANVLLPNSLGQPRDVGGIAMYIRSNAPRVAFPYMTPVFVDDAPTIFDLGTFTQPDNLVFSEAAQTLSMGFDNTDAWANESGAAMMVYIGGPQNPSKQFYKGPYRFGEAILGDDTTAPTSPESINSPFPFVAGQNMYARVNVTRLDGRLASSFQARTLASA